MPANSAPSARLQLPRLEPMSAHATLKVEPGKCSARAPSPAPAASQTPPTRPARASFFCTLPGLSSFASHPEDVSEYLKPLIEYAAARVPVELQHQTPLYLLATAGLRLLPLSQQADVLQAACLAIRAQGSFQFDCHQARVVSGEAEGVFGWLAVNYLRGHLQQQVTPGHGASEAAAPASAASEPVGFMDMGGGSAQLVFQVTGEVHRARARPLPLFTDETVDSDDDGGVSTAVQGGPSTGDDDADADDAWNVYEFDLSFDPARPHPFRVYGVSHLEFGVNAARRRYEQALAAGGHSEDPCRHEGAPDNRGTERPYYQTTLTRGLAVPSRPHRRLHPRTLTLAFIRSSAHPPRNGHAGGRWQRRGGRPRHDHQGRERL